MAVVGDRLFTQEQRGDTEAVVCLDTATGHEVWSHEDRARFWDGVSGAGPRATPAFDGGRIYSLGGTGILNCLDAATGKRLWTRNIAEESGASVPGWGFSGSPLVTGPLVVVYAGGPNEKGLLAYRADTGQTVWHAAAGQMSYSSPQLVSLGGQEQILMLSDGGLFAVDPASGKSLWTAGTPTPGAPLSLQPHALNDSQILATSPADFGLALVDLTRTGDTWEAIKRWGSGEIHPSFNDFVICKGYIFGFNEAIFACLDIENGKRRWKKGRYGHGQVVLLAEQELLIVLAETGDVVLLTTNPDRLEEIGRFKAIEGKTWNHPAIAHGRLYVRNAEEMACYELATSARDAIQE
jgi:outer membrane protein assembly factor BamB